MNKIEIPKRFKEQSFARFNARNAKKGEHLSQNEIFISCPLCNYYNGGGSRCGDCPLANYRPGSLTVGCEHWIEDRIFPKNFHVGSLSVWWNSRDRQLVRKQLKRLREFFESDVIWY
jgi:hypothetical protein